MTKGKISQGGYTWWSKDWASDETVFDLTLSERGLYRELIDMAMSHNNKVRIKNYNSLARRWNSTVEEVKNGIESLEKQKLVEWVDEEFLSVPSCEKRLAAIRSGRKGGKGSGKGSGKGLGKQTETETETETETTSTKEDEILAEEIKNHNALLSYKVIARKMNNEKTLLSIVNNKYKGEFYDFKSDEAKMNAFRHVMMDFNNNLVATLDTHKTPKEYAGHLHNWIRKQKSLNRFNVYPWQYFQHKENGMRALNKDGEFIVRKDLKVDR